MLTFLFWLLCVAAGTFIGNLAGNLVAPYSARFFRFLSEAKETGKPLPASLRETVFYWSVYLLSLVYVCLFANPGIPGFVKGVCATFLFLAFIQRTRDLKSLLEDPKGK